MSNIIYRGESKTLQFTIKNANGTAANLTGGSATWRLASSLTATASITKSGVLTNPAGGIVTVLLDEVDTQPIAAGKWIYELLVLLDGNTIVASQGTIDVLEGLFV